MRSVGALSRRPQSRLCRSRRCLAALFFGATFLTLVSIFRLSRVASFCAELRLVRRQKVELRVMSSLAAQSGVAVAFSSSLFHHRLQVSMLSAAQQHARADRTKASAFGSAQRCCAGSTA